MHTQLHASSSAMCMQVVVTVNKSRFFLIYTRCVQRALYADGMNKRSLPIRREDGQLWRQMWRIASAIHVQSIVHPNALFIENIFGGYRLYSRTKIVLCHTGKRSRLDRLARCHFAPKTKTFWFIAANYANCTKYRLRRQNWIYYSITELCVSKHFNLQAVSLFEALPLTKITTYLD